MPKPLTKQEADIFVRNFPAFVEETRRNFSEVNKSLNLFNNKLDDLYRLMGKATTESHIVNQQVKVATDKMEDHKLLMTEAITSSVEHLNQTVDQAVENGNALVLKDHFTFGKLFAKILHRHA